MYIIIVGCGRVGSELAKLLSGEGHDVVVVDREQKSFDRLGNTFNGITLVGNGFELELLRHAGIEKADAVCSVTNGDNTNLIVAQVARKIFKVPKVIARVYDPQRANLYDALGLDILSGTILFAAMIRDKIVESRFSSYLIESKDIGVLEVEVKDDLAGKTIADINVPGEFMVVALRRLAGVTIPEPRTAVMKKDVLMAVVKVDALEKIKKQLNLAGG
jgi:trk system potassium uptake protein TrkA